MEVEEIQEIQEEVANPVLEARVSRNKIYKKTLKNILLTKISPILNKKRYIIFNVQKIVMTLNRGRQFSKKFL